MSATIANQRREMAKGKPIPQVLCNKEVDEHSARHPKLTTSIGKALRQKSKVLQTPLGDIP